MSLKILKVFSYQSKQLTQDVFKIVSNVKISTPAAYTAHIRTAGLKGD